MWHKFKKQIEKIQNSDENTKKRWLIGASAMAIILIIVIWIIYINYAIKPVDQIKNNQKIGFWQILKNGLNMTTQYIKDQITAKRIIIIEK